MGGVRHLSRDGLRRRFLGNLIPVPKQPNRASIGLMGPEHDPDPAGVLEVGEGGADSLFTASQVLGQPGIGRRARRLSACDLEEGGGEEDGFVLAPEAGILAEVMGESGERERLGLGSRIWGWGRTLPPSGPRCRGRRGASGCRAVHGRSPRSPARSRAWNVGAERTARSSATCRSRSSGASGPKRGGASEEFSVLGPDRPLHWFVGRLE